MIKKVENRDKILWLAVLKRAFQDLLKAKYRASAIKWFFKPNMGLEEICNALGLDHKKTRDRAMFVLQHRDDPKIRKMINHEGNG